MEKHYKWLIGLGILLHLTISLITYHPDLRAFVLAGKFINQGEVFTFYDHISKLPRTDLLAKSFGDDIFIYPSLAYLIPAAIQLPFSGLLEDAYNTILYQENQVYQHRQFYLPLLVFKLPALLFSLLTLLFIPRLFAKKEHGQKAQLLWLFFPTNLFVASGMGQVDTILTFFLLASFINIKKGRLGLASIFISLSALIKPLGLILLPLVAIKSYKKSGFLGSIKATLPGVLTWLLVVSPYLFSPAFKMYSLFGSLTTKTIYAGIAVAGSTVIPWFFIVFVLICILLYEKKLSLINSLGLTILATLAFNHFHPQWFLWIVPWLLYITITRDKLFLLLMFALSWLLIWLSFDFSLHLGMFLSLREIFPASLQSPLNNSEIVLLARAAILSGLVYFLRV